MWKLQGIFYLLRNQVKDKPIKSNGWDVCPHEFQEWFKTLPSEAEIKEMAQDFTDQTEIRRLLKLDKPNKRRSKIKP
jgi:hypothetical protein